MGCCGGTRKHRVAFKGKSIQSISGVKAQPRPIKIGSKRLANRKTCPQCGWPMSNSIRKYDPRTKKAIQVWTCMKKTCRYKI
jgi:ribosomal protein L37E